MSAFNNSNDNNNGPAAFFKKLKKGVTDTVQLTPVPGILKMRPATGNETIEKKNSMNSSSSTVTANKAASTTTTGRQTTISTYKISQYEQLLSKETIDLSNLRKLSWNGIPPQFRTEVWQMLLGYMPVNKERRETAIARKRKEYLDSIPMYFNISDTDRTTQEGELLRQILVDLPRTCPNTPFFHQPPIQEAMERILYVWATRHPASGYVQGMNDLLTPLLLVAIHPFCADPLRCDVTALGPNILSYVEADAYWCFTKLLDDIQDHYTFSQPGLQRMILRLEDLTHRLDNELHQHLMDEGILYMQFSFRWMNCALLRELPLRAIIRLWDSYFAEEHGGFENFHVYVCAVILKMHRDRLMSMQFQEILMFLQDLPTADWVEDDVEPILSQAFILSTLFDSSPNHLG